MLPLSKGMLLKAIPPTVIIALAMFVGWWFYPEPLPIQFWASIRELHATWDDADGQMDISMKFEKHQDCRRVVVNKHLRPIRGNDVIGTNPLPLNGDLDHKMLLAPLGETVIFDHAAPRGPVRQGQYLLTVTALCEQDGSPNGATLLSTVPIEAILVVQGMPTLSPGRS